MKVFLMLVGAALVLAVAAFVLFRRAKGWTRFFLGVAAVSACAFPLCAVLHNAAEALLHADEPVFFLAAVIGAPAGVVVGFVGAAIARRFEKKMGTVPSS
ncbi:MAG TPA: hypothetical protein VFV19_16445 [Candidatus Polarisedimenticolaceae bacterium]|nr:hypothetical protein [Candidatus Polarisedimenticolaceae bacterium]